MTPGPGPAAEGRRWSVPPPVVDVVILAVLLVPQLLIVGSLTGRVATTVPAASPVLLGVALTVAHLPVLLRRHRPWTAAGLTLLASVPLLAWGDPVPGLAMAVLAHSVGHRGRFAPAGTGSPIGRVPTTVVVAAGLALMVLVTALAQWAVGATVAPVAAVGVGAATGLARREVTRRRSERRERADVAAVEAALAADRRRIGAELHEVVRARLVEIVSHADRARSGADAPEAALEAIARDTRGALTALREMLTLLRAPDAPASPLPAGRGGDRDGEPDRGGHLAGRLRKGLDAVDGGDIVLAVALAAAVPLVARLAPGAPAPLAVILTAPGTVAGWALLAACLVPVVWRRRYASAGVWVATVAITLSSLAVSGGYTVASVAWSVLVVTAVSRDSWRRWVPAVVFGAVAGLAGLPLMGPGQPTLPVLVVAGTSHAVLVGWGLTVRWRRSVRTAARLRQRRAREAVSRREQRLRIARDLHDVVAHHVSGMAVQAGTAHALAAARPDLVSDALAHVRETGAGTLAAMPALLDVLDGDAPASGSFAGDDVDRLAGPLRAAGAPVEVQVTGTPEIAGQVAGEVRLLVQEALTNVLRHAGPAPTRVRVRRLGDAVEVTVCDEGPVGGHRADPGGGFGLVGMRERVAVLGGEIETGPAGAGWRVHARLPCTPP